jgi:F420-0:gamma-glutamyl ligase-like protein
MWQLVIGYLLANIIIIKKITSYDLENFPYNETPHHLVRNILQSI